ncbi:Protein of unknown function [Lactobacillus delbrueckii subsp. lactis]|nr:Protein of unknown function [Lactobacillus delbrueckii subsp. bulgaricus]CDR77935.1 Putative uncharacterized protein [Lactobacillus delbrueckii subsp. lactis]CDR85720.1 Protein of unknown function [Lactobacillus delbrueckii subsp. lactis]
MNKETD